MRIAHLILTYTDPAQTERMIKNMVHENVDFYIHLDKKCDLNDYIFIQKIPNVYFIKERIDIKWGGFSTTSAMFEGIKGIVATGIEYAFINLISGQDYPLVPATVLLDFYQQNIGKEFISYKDIKTEWEDGLIRMQRYSFPDYKFKGKYTLESLFNHFLPKRKIPYDLHPYGESMFWMLSPAAAMYVVDKVENDKKLKTFFSLSWGNDEFVFQTILLNSPFKENVVNENYRYIDWSLGGGHPKVLDEKDFEGIRDSKMFFTRKLEKAKSAKLMELIDRNLLNL